MRLAPGIHLIDRWSGPRFQVRVRIGKRRYEAVSLPDGKALEQWASEHPGVIIPKELASDPPQP